MHIRGSGGGPSERRSDVTLCQWRLRFAASLPQVGFLSRRAVPSCQDSPGWWKILSLCYACVYVADVSLYRSNRYTNNLMASAIKSSSISRQGFQYMKPLFAIGVKQGIRLPRKPYTPDVHCSNLPGI